MDYNFYRGILLGDAHSKHILIILLIDWWNFRKLQEWFFAFEWDEDRTQNRKPNSVPIKTWNYSRMNIFEALEFCIMDWEYYKWNNAALFL